MELKDEKALRDFREMQASFERFQVLTELLASPLLPPTLLAPSLTYMCPVPQKLSAERDRIQALQSITGGSPQKGQ
jgi:hypothetical protein